MDNQNKYWCALFSQTGNEIYNISKAIKRFPDVIVTNIPISGFGIINFDLLRECFDRIVFVPGKPTAEEYLTAIPENSLVTLHGYLRIIPAEVCEQREIFNSHPADLSDPEQAKNLKGKDPQARAVELGYKMSGNTIHRCIPEVDAGEIMCASQISIEGCDVQAAIARLHKNASQQWITFLQEKLQEK